jgi:uncharacterized protein YbaR (Trm112 family)
MICPRCRKNKRLLQVRPETSAVNLVVYCRMCKSEINVNIDKGECFESHGQ